MTSAKIFKFGNTESGGEEKITLEPNLWGEANIKKKGNADADFMQKKAIAGLISEKEGEKPRSGTIIVEEKIDAER